MIVSTQDELLDLLFEIRNADTVYLDTETTGLDMWGSSRICGIVVGFDDERTFYVPVRHMPDPSENLPASETLRAFGRSLNKRPRNLVFHNAKFDVQMFYVDDVDLLKSGHTVHDTYILAHLTDETRFTKALKALGKTVLRDDNAADLQDFVKQAIKDRGYSLNLHGYAEFPAWDLAPYAEQDIHLTRRLFKALLSDAKQQGLLEVYARERKVQLLSLQMERRGIYVDRAYCEKAIERIHRELSVTQGQLGRFAAEAGVDLDGHQLTKTGKVSKKLKWEGDPWLSRGAVKEVAEGLGLRSGKPTKAAIKAQEWVEENGGFDALAAIAGATDDAKIAAVLERATEESWDKSVLQQLREVHPFCDALISYRQFHKLNTTYFKNFLRRTTDEDPTLHASFNPVATRTGRFSSSDPNLQNLPAPGEVDSDRSAFEVKRAIVPRPGRVFVLGDYSGMEIAVLAQLSKEETLIRSIRAGEDPHTNVARSSFPWFEESDYETKKTLRRTAKTLNFSILYGAGIKTIAQRLTAAGVPTTEEEAKELRERYFAGMPAVKAYRSSIYRALDIPQPRKPLKRECGCVACKPESTKTHDCLREAWQAQADAGTLPYEGPTPTLRNPYGRVFHYNILRLKKPRPNPWTGQLEVFYVKDSHAGMNHAVQGTSADLVKEKMLEVQEWIEAEDADLLLTVHDELVIECLEEDAERLGRRLKETLEDVPNFIVPMRADMSIAYKSWADKKPFKLLDKTPIAA